MLFRPQSPFVEVVEFAGEGPALLQFLNEVLFEMMYRM